VLLLLTLAIVIAEEVLWRAYLIGHLPGGAALLVAGFSFGSIHLHFGTRTVVFKSVAGWVWGGLYLLTGSLWTPIASHFLYDCLVWHRLRRAGRQATHDERNPTISATSPSDPARSLP
jgi:membrane protease YdiL (CAAX protease family)